MSERQKFEKVIPICKHCNHRIRWDNSAKRWVHDNGSIKHLKMIQPYRVNKRKYA